VIVADLDESARNVKALRLAPQRHRKRALGQFTQQRSVPWQDSHIAILARNLRRLRLLLQHQFFRRRDVDLESVCHGRLALLLHVFPGLEHIVDRALHVERLLRNLVVLAFDYFLETAHGIGHLDVLAFEAGERFGDRERL